MFLADQFKWQWTGVGEGEAKLPFRPKLPPATSSPFGLLALQCERLLAFQRGGDDVATIIAIHMRSAGRQMALLRAELWPEVAENGAMWFNLCVCVCVRVSCAPQLPRASIASVAGAREGQMSSGLERRPLSVQFAASLSPFYSCFCVTQRARAQKHQI